ncbi:MAG TPA: hypothetical protein VG347_03520 [Verrucomicrobiae bacterium]|nr:hypothetical protein [Verrucomicrobiae bacterium]
MINSSNIKIGPGYKTWSGGTFRFNDGGIRTKFVVGSREVSAEEFGRFDTVDTDRRIVTTGKLWSGYENLSLVLPGVAFNPVIGGQLYGIANLAGVINGQDGSRLTTMNEQITKLANMELAVEKDLWSADIEFTSLLKAGMTPDQAGAYYTYTTGNAYNAPVFNKSNFRAPILNAGWNGTLSNNGTSFGAFVFRKGLQLEWKWDLDWEPCYVDGYGTLDAIINGFEVSAKGTPIGVLEADAAASLIPAQALGTLRSGNAGDLTLTFGSNTIIGKQMYVASNDGFAWARKTNRISDLTLRSTVPFSAGVPIARASAN